MKKGVPKGIKYLHTGNNGLPKIQTEGAEPNIMPCATKFYVVEG